MAVRTRAIAARAGVVLGIAAVVVAGGLLAGLRGGGASTTPPAAPSAVRATLDPVTSLTGDATQVSELQSRLALHPPMPASRAISASPTCSARARRTTPRTTRRRTRCSIAPSSATRAGSTPRSARARSRSPTTISARRCGSGKRALALSHGFSPPALAMIGDASVELGRYQQGFAAFARLGHLRPGLVAYARLSYSRELQGDVAGATRLMRRAVDAGSGAPENTQWTRVQLATLLLKSGHTDAAAKEYRHALALLPNYARAEAGLGAVAVARGNLAAGRSTGTSARPRICRCPTSSPSSATCARRAATPPAPGRPTRSSASRTRSSSAPAATPISRPRSSTPRIRARCRAPRWSRWRARRWPSARRSTATTRSPGRSTRTASAARRCRRQLLANRLGTIDPQLSWHLGAIAACAGKRDAGAHGAAQGARAHAALPSARRTGRAPAAGGVSA